MYETVYLNTETIGRTLIYSNFVSFKTDTAGNDLNISPAGIVLKFIVCGNELLSLSTAGSTTVFYLELNTIILSKIWIEPYTTWFDLNIVSTSHATCNIERYYLGGCYSPGYSNIEYNNPLIHRISMPSTSLPNA